MLVRFSDFIKLEELFGGFSIDHFAVHRVCTDLDFRVFFQPSPKLVEDAFAGQLLIGAIEDFTELACYSVHGSYV